LAFEHGEEIAQYHADGFLEEFFLVFEIIIDERAVEAGLFADEPDSGAFKALVGEDADRGLEYFESLA